MQVRLRDLIINSNLKKSEKKNDEFTKFLDLEYCAIDFDIDSSYCLIREKDRNEFPSFFVGAVLKADFKLIFNKSLAPNSSVAVFSAHSTDKPFITKPKDTSIFQKFTQWLQLRTKKLWYLLILQRPFEYNLTSTPKVTYEEIDEENLSDDRLLSVITDDLKIPSEAKIDGSTKINTSNSSKKKYVSFFTEKDQSSYRFSMNLDSSNFNPVVLGSEAFWISIKDDKSVCYKPLALCIPTPIISKMVYLTANPSYLNVDLNETKKPTIKKPISFSRSDKESIKIYFDIKNKEPFISTKNLSDTSAEISVNLKTLRKLKDKSKEIEIFYLNFIDHKSADKLKITIPLIVHH